MVVKSGGLGLQQLEVRLLIPGQRLRPGHGGKSAKSYPTRPATRSWHWLCRKKFPQRWKVVKLVFIREKGQYMWIDTQADSERVSPSWF